MSQALQRRWAVAMTSHDGSTASGRPSAHGTVPIGRSAGVGSSSWPGEAEEFARILDEDPELGQGLSDADRRAATALLQARVISVGIPRWEPPGFDPEQTFGLLVLEGLLGRRVLVGNAISTELLGAGDILRPWDEPNLWNLVPPELSWRVYRPARLAVLDERITAIIGRRRQLIVAFSSRLLRRARHSAYLGAITHMTRVEDRLLLTLWHLASNWGRVTLEGVVIPYRLTHAVLAEIVGAQRPSVSVAFGELQRRGDVIRRSDGCYALPNKPEEVLKRLHKPRADPLFTPNETVRGTASPSPPLSDEPRTP